MSKKRVERGDVVVVTGGDVQMMSYKIDRVYVCVDPFVVSEETEVVYHRHIETAILTGCLKPANFIEKYEY